MQSPIRFRSFNSEQEEQKNSLDPILILIQICVFRVKCIFFFFMTENIFEYFNGKMEFYNRIILVIIQIEEFYSIFFFFASLSKKNKQKFIS